MQMVSVSKLRRAKNDMEDASTYNTLMLQTLRNLKRNSDLEQDEERLDEELGSLAKIMFGDADKSKKILSVVVTSERGLCGGFNQYILRKAKQDIDKLQSDGAKVQIITIGKKGRDWILFRYGADSIIAHYANPQTKVMQTEGRAICESILRELEAGDYDGLRIYYTKFKNAVSQVPEVKVVAPMSIESDPSAAEDYESEGPDLLNKAIKMYITSEVYYALLESRTSEEAARMVAMDNATKNAGEMVQKLTLLLNRSRQASITTELIEIISGAEAV